MILNSEAKELEALFMGVLDKYFENPTSGAIHKHLKYELPSTFYKHFKFREKSLW